jgi:D-aminopeptidase
MAVEPVTTTVTHLAHQEISPLFEATSEATEEAIFNAMLQSETTEGRDWLTVQALTPEALKQAIADVRDSLAAS